MIKDGNPVRDTQHKLHVVLYKDKRHSDVFELADDGGKRADFFGHQPCSRLVKEQDSRMRCQRTRDFDQPAMPICEIGCRYLLKMRNSN